MFSGGAEGLNVFIVPGVIALVLLIIYYVFMARAVLQMLVRDTNTVLLTFSFLALIPIPPTVIMGILVMIIWICHRGYCRVTRS